MILSRILVATLGLALGLTSASATIRLADDGGGRIGDYVDRYNAAREANERIIIDGKCYSACTLVLGFVPRSKICVTENAVLGFHAAWIPTAEGGTTKSTDGTDALWSLYPARVRDWIKKNGGLSKEVIYLQGKELAALYPPCQR